LAAGDKSKAAKIAALQIDIRLPDAALPVASGGQELFIP
jgi:hypothetical protein